MIGRLFRSKWYWRIKIGLLLLLVGGPLLYMIVVKSRGQSSLADTLNQLDASDPNWRMADLMRERNARVQAMEPNGWKQMEKAIESLPTGWDQQSEPLREQLDKLQPNELPSPLAVEELRALLEANRSSIALAKEMTRFPEGGREVQPPANPLTMLLTEVQQARGIFALLQYTSKEAAIAGRPAEAMTCTLAILNASRSLGDEPILITQLVRMAGRAIATGSLKTTLALTVTDQQLAEVQAEFWKEADVNLLYPALRGERAFADQIFVLMQSGNTAQLMAGMAPGAGPAAPGILGRIGLWGMQSFLPANHKYCLDHLTEMIAISQKPYDEQWQLVANVPPIPKGVRYLFVSLLMPAIDRMTQAALRSRGDLLATAVGIACERYRLKHQKWPDTLADIPKDILPSIPNDPFTGKPINYKILPDGVVVYTIGPDAKDDGGNVLQGEKPMTDYGIRLWNPEFRRQSPPNPTLPESQEFDELPVVIPPPGDE